MKDYYRPEFDVETYAGRLSCARDAAAFDVAATMTAATILAATLARIGKR
jgi:hypothetical protein